MGELLSKNISINLLKTGLPLMNSRGFDFNNLIKDSGAHFGYTILAVLDLEERSNQPFK